MSQKRFYQGVYEVKNREKYLGAQMPVYRSSWEYYVYKHFDLHPSVLQWHVEPIYIPYFSNVKGRNSHYLPDLYAKIRKKDHSLEELLIEIKPKEQTKKPRKSKNKSQKVFLEEQQTYENNLEKWEAAKEYCKKRGIKFMILTENDIFK